MEQIRAFIAISIPLELQQRIGQIQAGLRGLPDNISWVRPEGMHFTLKFLGNIAQDQVEGISLAIRESVEGIAAFELHFGQLGAFPSARRPRVIWLGLDHLPVPLSAIYRKLSDKLIPLGFPPEERGFSPHLTLGRIKFLRNAQNLAQTIAKIEMPTLEPIQVKRIILFRSQLQPKGAVYTALSECKLLA